jgi:ribosomal protein S18 acetylase RimI-like enzyme
VKIVAGAVPANRHQAELIIAQVVQCANDKAYCIFALEDMMLFRPYNLADKPACSAIFASNIPKYFAPHEQAEFDSFLDEPECTYFVVEDEDGLIVGCGGYYINTQRRVGALCWGMVANDQHHLGIGRYLLNERLRAMCREGLADVVVIDTSQHTAPFFQKAGFVTNRIIPDHYGPGLHSYQMSLQLESVYCQSLAESRL